jgi:hypothetical protein
MLQTPNSRNQREATNGFVLHCNMDICHTEKHKARNQAKQTKQTKQSKSKASKQASKQKAKEAQTQANKQAPARQASALHTPNENACDVEQTQRIYHFTPQAYTTHTLRAHEKRLNVHSQKLGTEGERRERERERERRHRSEIGSSHKNSGYAKEKSRRIKVKPQVIERFQNVNTGT